MSTSVYGLLGIALLYLIPIVATVWLILLTIYVSRLSRNVAAIKTELERKRAA